MTTENSNDPPLATNDVLIVESFGDNTMGGNTGAISRDELSFGKGNNHPQPVISDMKQSRSGSTL